MERKLANQIAIITGAGSSIGAGVAKVMAKAGAKVVINYPINAARDMAEKVKEIAVEILSQSDLFYVCFDMDQTYANLNKDLPAALRARCDKAYTNLDPRSIQSGSGSGSGSGSATQ